MNTARQAGRTRVWTFTRITALIGTVLLLQACIYADGGGWDDDDRPRFREQQPTVGQQLIDLDRARAAGVISDSEYERIKANIIDATE